MQLECSKLPSHLKNKTLKEEAAQNLVTYLCVCLQLYISQLYVQVPKRTSSLEGFLQGRAEVLLKTLSCQVWQFVLSYPIRVVSRHMYNKTYLLKFYLSEKAIQSEGRSESNATTHFPWLTSTSGLC
ncbi:hypothetical protein PanWU01x14_104820 [Parasponia andersonii]|uniref:Uncharacterized protein n=1 Tax=Parasponia andersonii TaxID=3476 RepID=A0A2P5D1H6_PARAD|nr:hypothetical protein PanWU01x14_104820 [Parasponia andersonii]